MKIKDVEIGSTVSILGNKAKVLRHGNMGTGVKVTSVPPGREDSLTLGNQIWDSNTEVELIEK